MSAANIGQAIGVWVTSGVSRSIIGALTAGPVVKEIVGDTISRVSRSTQADGVERNVGTAGCLGESAGICSISFIETGTCSVGAVGETVGEQNLHPEDSRAAPFAG